MTFQIFLSGGAGNTDPDSSLGGIISSTQMTDATVENLFDNIKRKEILVGKSEYRGFYIKNSSSTLPIHGAVIYVDQDPNQTTVSFAVDPALTGNGSTTGVMQTIPTEDTPPTGVTFEDINEYKVKLPLPTLKPLEVVGVWMKRIAVGSGAAETITVGFTMTGDEESLIPANLTISTIDISNPGQVNCSTSHNLETGNVVTISGSNSTPSIDGVWTITYVDADSFTIPIQVTGSGSAGTVAVGGDIYNDGQDNISVGERTSFTNFGDTFEIGEAQIGFSLIT